MRLKRRYPSVALRIEQRAGFARQQPSGLLP
jgi:hypothetical protein